MNFSKNIVELRKSKGLTSAQMAQTFGIDAELYQEYELGIKQPSMQHINIIANFYGIDAYDLVKGKIRGGKSSSLVVYNKTPKLNIAILILSALFFVIAGFTFVEYNLHIDSVYLGTAAFSFYEVIGNFASKYVVMCILLLIITIWDVIDSILLLLPASFTCGSYSKISKRTRLITGIVEPLLFVVLVLMLINAEITISPISLAFGAIYITKFILKLVAFKKMKQEK